MTSSKTTPLRFPPIYLLNYGFHGTELDELHDLEEEIGGLHEDGPLVRNIGEAKVVLGKASKKARAALEFRKLGVWTEEVGHGKVGLDDHGREELDAPRKKKKRKVEKNKDGKEVIMLDSSTESEDEPSLSLRPTQRSPGTSSSPAQGSRPVPSSQPSPGTSIASQDDLFSGDTVKVVKLEWYYDSLKAGCLLPTARYLVYEGRIVEKPGANTPIPPIKISRFQERSKASTPPRSQTLFKHRTRRSRDTSSPLSQRPSLRPQTTSEHDLALDIPPLPASCEKKYSCERPTPLTCPNDPFITELKKIKAQRKLTESPNKKGTQVSFLAYGRAIASIAAYPYTITSSAEISRLPHCGEKYRALYEEWRQTGTIREVSEIEADPRLRVLKTFYEIFDVGETKARAFYARGWRDLDDFVLHWSELTANIQVGVKFYDDFQERIPRRAVEDIAGTILEYANRLRPGYQGIIVGGYRRGKELCGDVDVILTHPDEDATVDFIDEIVHALGEDRWVPHLLKTYTKNSSRGQQTVSWKGSMAGGEGGGSGFCTLDKAFLVWQDANLFHHPVEGMRNVKRRVDIIIAPWKVAGCAIVGWSGGTMFERDLRSFCRRERGLKFDSTGVRRLSDGEWVDLERGEETLDGKERAVFRGLGLEWRDPTERCTG